MGLIHYKPTDNSVAISISQEPVTEFSSGAKRSAKKPRYDLLSLDMHKRMAAVWEKGLSTYGERNWQKGANDPEYRIDIHNHIFEHLLLYMAGDKSADHLAHLGCNLQMLMHFEALDNAEQKSAGGVYA